MALSYVESAWNTAGTLVTGQGYYKDLTFANVSPGDLLVVAGFGETYNFTSGARAVSTQAGTTSAWTLVVPSSAYYEDTEVVVAYATASSSGTITAT